MTTLSVAPPSIPEPTPLPRPIGRTGMTGGGEVRLEQVAGRTAVTKLVSRSPLKLLAPRAPGAVARVFLSSFGGGLVAGDTLDLTIDAGRDTRTLVTTQASTKVYRSPEGVAARQQMTMQVGRRGVIVVLPDPITCFADAAYEQTQRVELDADATLVLVDWITAGRTRCGERWAFSRYRSHTEIRRAGRTLIADGVWLDRTHGPIDSPFRMGRFNCLAVAYVVGPGLGSTCDAIERSVAGGPPVRRTDLLTVASRIENGLILRVAGDTAEAVGRVLRQRLDFVTDLLGESPWDRKW